MYTLKNIDGIIFDMDGVIFDTEALSMRCWKKVGERYKKPIVSIDCFDVTERENVVNGFSQRSVQFAIRSIISKERDRCVMPR